MDINFEAHLSKLSHSLNEEVVIVTDSNGIPSHWLDYLNTNSRIRQSGITNELSKIEQYFPELIKTLKPKTIDAFLFKTEKNGICRAFVHLIDGKEYLAISRLPWKYKTVEPTASYTTFQNNIHIALYWIYYNIMDGLTDIYGCAGFKPSYNVFTITKEENMWAEMDWYSEFSSKHNINKIYELLNTGGGGYLLLDLNSNWRDKNEFKCFYVNVKDIAPPELVHLFPYLDYLMSIGLAE